MMQDNFKNEIHLRDYLAIVRQRYWLIILVTLVVAALVLLVTLQTPKVYRASAQILIERESNKYVQLEEVLSVDASSSDYYQTQYKILVSNSMADRVIKELDLVNNPEFGPKAPKGLWGAKISPIISLVTNSIVGLISSTEGNSQPASAEARLLGVRRIYLSRLTIEPVPRSRLVKISFDAFRPELAAKVANTHAQAYIARSLETKFAASKDAVDWLTAKLGNLKKNLEASEKKLQSFQESENLVALENNNTRKGSDVENIQAQKLAELTSQLTTARTEAIALETQYQQLQTLSKQPGMVEALPQVINNPLVQKLKARLVELNEEYSELKEKYGQKHPRMVTIRNELITVRQRISAEVGKIGKSVEIQYQMALSKKNSLERALDRAKKEALVLSKKAAQYRYLKREADTNRQLYQMVMQRAKEADLTSGLSSTNIHIIDKASAPLSPFSPQVLRRMALAVLVGLMLGIGLVFLLNYMDNTIHSPDDVKKMLGVPALGTASYFNIAKDKKGTFPELIMLNHPRSDFAEGLRNVRTNISFSLITDEPKVIAVSSPVPGDGKTRIATNLAVAIAQTGQRVVFVDADLRRPRGHTVFNLKSKPGFTNVIAGQIPLTEALMDVGIPGFSVLPAGSIPPNPAELLSSKRCHEVIGSIRKEADVVIIDTPPIVPFADPSILAGTIDGIIMVIRGSVTTADNASTAVQILRDVRANVLGIVLNWQDRAKEQSYYKYYGYYSKGYSYKYRSEYTKKKEGDA